MAKAVPITFQVKMDEDAESFIRNIVREELEAEKKRAQDQFRKNIKQAMRNLDADNLDDLDAFMSGKQPSPGEEIQ